MRLLGGLTPPARPRPPPVGSTPAQDDPQPDDVRRVAGDDAVPRRRPAEPRGVQPRPAPDDPEFAFRRSRRVGLGAAGVLPVPVGAPLPDVAVHLAQPHPLGGRLPTGTVSPRNSPFVPW